MEASLRTLLVSFSHLPRSVSSYYHYHQTGPVTEDWEYFKVKRIFTNILWNQLERCYLQFARHINTRLIHQEGSEDVYELIILVSWSHLFGVRENFTSEVLPILGITGP